MAGGVEQELADCLDRIERGEATVEDVLADHPGLAAELGPLLGLAEGLRSLRSLTAPAGLRGSGRPLFASRQEQLPAEAASHPFWAAFRPSIKWARPATRLAAGFAAAFMLLGGGVIASAGSLPEEPLYPVKLAVEGVQLALAPDPEARTELQLQFAERRLAEAESAAAQGRQESLERGMALYEQQVEGVLQGAQPSLDGGDQAEATPLQQSLAKQQEQLTRILARAPEPAQPAILHAMEVSKQGKPPRGDERRPASVAPTRPAAVAAMPAPTAVATAAPASPAAATRALPSPTAPGPMPTARDSGDEERKPALAMPRNQGEGKELNQPDGVKKNRRAVATRTPVPTQAAKDEDADGQDEDRPDRSGRSRGANGRDRGEVKAALPSPMPATTATPAPTQTATPRHRDPGATVTPTPRAHSARSSPAATPTVSASHRRDRTDQDKPSSGNGNGNRGSKPDKSERDTTPRGDRRPR